MQFTIKQGMNQDILKSYPDNHFDSIVTDPPYGIEFLGKDWDSNTGAVETWEQCFRVLKPGGHLLAFSAARTYHHLATNIENCGFEIRDQLMWIYASGFPKAQDIGKAIQKRQGVEKSKPQDGINAFKKDGGMSFGHNGEFGNKKDEVIPTSPEAQQWAGWKTALKPAHEPIVMARKPFKGSAIDNVLEHGTGALNIDATRITTDNPPNKQVGYDYGATIGGADPLNRRAESNIDHQYIPDDKGRFPSNVFGEIEDYQKYFYCPKVSRAERHCGFEQNNIPTSEGGMYDNHGTGVMYNIGTDMKSKKSSLDHIPTDSDGMLDKGVLYQHTKGGSLGDSAPVGERRCSKDSFERLTQSMEYRKGGKPDPLSHIATGNNFGDGLSTGVDIMTKAKGSIMSTEDMIEAMGGKLTGANRVWTPDLGEFYIHGLKEEYKKWCEKNNKATGSMGNNHPTVKPVALMSYLVKLVTPEGGKVLDPFNGSGSTGMACVQHGFDYTGCELDPNYVEIATKRINGWYNKTQPDNNFNELFDNK